MHAYLRDVAHTIKLTSIQNAHNARKKTNLANYRFKNVPGMISSGTPIKMGLKVMGWGLMDKLSAVFLKAKSNGAKAVSTCATNIAKTLKNN